MFRILIGNLNIFVTDFMFDTNVKQNLLNVDVNSGLSTLNYVVTLPDSIKAF